MLENILKIRYREDLDMPERITKDTYRKQRPREKVHKKRILGSLSRIGDRSGDESGVHLDFCLTGYYPRGKHYICAVWPDQPNAVDFYFTSNLKYESLYGGWVHGPYHSNLDDPGSEISAKSDPEIITIDYSRRSDAPSYYYMFFSQNPHQSHRPYFFSGFDSLFTIQDQDDAKVVDFHSPKILQSWHKNMDLANRFAVGEMSPDKLRRLGKFTFWVDHHIGDLFEEGSD